MATQDINGLYLRVIRSNERLQRLKKLAAPEVVINNEYRIFEDAVSALLSDDEIAGFTVDIGAVAFQVCFDHIAGALVPFPRQKTGSDVVIDGPPVVRSAELTSDNPGVQL